MATPSADAPTQQDNTANGSGKVGRWALVTGASSGIGEALAREIARHGHDVVLVARRQDKLAELADDLAGRGTIRAEVVAADLTAPDAPAALIAELDRRDLAIDILVNNAGAIAFGRFADTDAEQIDTMVALNVQALTGLCRRFVAPMRERGFGRILNVASTAAFLPAPSLAAYAATKAYVLSLTEGLAEELRGTGVTATALCPGMTDTELAKPLLSALPFSRLVPKPLVMSSPESVAREGYRACMAGEVVALPGLAAQATALGTRLPPKWLLRTAVGIVGRRLS